MNAFAVILFISMLTVTVFVFFAFFPINISWFYESAKPKKPKPPKHSKSRNTHIYPEFSHEYRNYAKDDFDNYDDPEL